MNLRRAIGPLASLTARLGLAGAFGAAGIIKLSRPEVFAVTLRAFGILPDWSVSFLSLALPCLEIAAALLVAAGRREGLVLMGGLLLVFIAVLANALRMGLDIDCGCYGPADPEREAFSSLRWTLWRDCAMLGVVAALAHCRRAGRARALS